uniref:ribosomal protein S18 n=1 Tax=Haramonas pauciplastida TaxID=478668 RepID=UPI00211393F2|nr:ribosomal protein S18 [Haramonas pauciplastida]UTE95009.1 ribosomal protein S18 [Haramonas pauciplastida]
MSKFYKKKRSSLNPNYIIKYKDIKLLKYFLTVGGKILPRRLTRVTLRQQRQLGKAIKRARTLNLLSHGYR